MKIRSFLAIIIALICLGLHPSQSTASDKISIVATTPDMAFFARRIGGDLVDVFTIATGVEDPHSVPMKPSFAVRLNRADIVISQGLGLEHAFLPGLLEAARNPKVLPGQPAYIDSSKYISPLEVPEKIDRAFGEQHPLGNPHFNLDPVMAKSIAKAIAEGLAENYPSHKAQFDSNLAKVTAELDVSIAKWQVMAAPLKGVKFVSYHPDVEYLAHRYGMIQVGTIEEKPGVDPTPGHIEKLVDLMKREQVKLVLRERHYPAELAQTIADKGGAKVADIIVMTGGVPEADDYFHFVDYNLQSLLAGIR